MISAVIAPRIGCEFDKFLYASVGNDRNGMPLTVLSALARVDVDPWEEASKLTRLPQASAVTQLASRLSALRNAPVADLDPAQIAGTLIALLPCDRDRAPGTLQALAQATAMRPTTAVSAVLTVFTYLIFMLMSQWLMGSLQTPGASQPAPAAAATTESASPPSSSETPPQLSGK